MPTIDDVYGVAVESHPVDRAVPVPEVKVTALARFGEDPAGLKPAALDVLNIKVRPVETTEAATRLADQRAQVKILLKDIEARRKLIVEPLKREATEVDAEARRWSEPLKAWDKDAERALLAYQKLEADRQRRAEAERQKALEDAARRQGEAEAQGKAEDAEAASLDILRAETAPPAVPVTGFKTDAGTTSLRKRWVVEVIKPEEVPDAYLVPDLQKLQAAVDAGAREIEGCNIYEKESLPVRTRG